MPSRIGPKGLTEIRRDAAGIVEPDKRVVVAGNHEAPAQHDVDDIMADLDPAPVVQFREFSLEVANAKARRAAGV